MTLRHFKRKLNKVQKQYPNIAIQLNQIWFRDGIHFVEYQTKCTDVFQTNDFDWFNSIGLTLGHLQISERYQKK